MCSVSTMSIDKLELGHLTKIKLLVTNKSHRYITIQNRKIRHIWKRIIPENRRLIRGLLFILVYGRKKWRVYSGLK